MRFLFLLMLSLKKRNISLRSFITKNNGKSLLLYFKIFRLLVCTCISKTWTTHLQMMLCYIYVANFQKAMVY
jgi:hypothetical protein